MKRIVAGLTPVVVFYLSGLRFGFQDVSVVVLLAILPIALLFIVAYLPERPWRSWFGTSMLLLAFSSLAVCFAAAQFRLGIQWIGPNVITALWIGLMFSSVVMRTSVLLASQWRDRFGLGGWIRRLLRR